MEKILADTSTWINTVSKSGHTDLKKFMHEKILNGQVFTTGMILCELLQGARNEAHFEKLKKEFQAFPLLTTDESLWTNIAKLSLQLRNKGVQASIPDLYISHVAMSNDCLLVHCDGDFEQIAKHTALKTMPFLP